MSNDTCAVASSAVPMVPKRIGLPTYEGDLVRKELFHQGYHSIGISIATLGKDAKEEIAKQKEEVAESLMLAYSLGHTSIEIMEVRDYSYSSVYSKISVFAK